VFAIPTIQFFTNDTKAVRCPRVELERLPIPWKSNSGVYDLVGSSGEVIHALKQYISSMLPSVLAGGSDRKHERKLSSRTIPAKLLARTWDQIFEHFQKSLEIADGSGGNPIEPQAFGDTGVLTYHHRAGLNYVLSEVNLDTLNHSHVFEERK
jgi:hypothetical protein